MARLRTVLITLLLFLVMLLSTGAVPAERADRPSADTRTSIGGDR